jgi:hypothetical protein
VITTCASNLGNVCIALMAASASQPLEFWSDDLAVLREIAPMAASASRADGSANVFARTAVESSPLPANANMLVCLAVWLPHAQELPKSLFLKYGPALNRGCMIVAALRSYLNRFS